MSSGSGHGADPAGQDGRRRGMHTVVWATRYALPAVIVIVALVFIAIDPSGNWEGAAALIGAGLSVLLLNFLYRMGVEGDKDRDREDRARRFYDTHGYWPDERRSRPGG